MEIVRNIVTAVLLVAFAASATLGSSMVPVAPGKGEPQRLRWKERTIKIAISDSLTNPSSNIKTDSDVLGALRRSVATWQEVAPIDIVTELTDRQSVSSPGVAGDDVSLITIAQTPENVLLFAKNPDAESAKTRVFYNGKSFITEADIVLNPYQQFSTDGTFGTFDLEATLTHEIGHLLGMRHSSVLGSTMSESLSKNGVFGFADLGPRVLSASDVSAIRELYGYGGDGETCCSAVGGKLIPAGGRSLKGVRIWAEEDGSGRVAAQTETGADGTYRLGGLSSGKYSIFWQKVADESSSPVEELGRVDLGSGETKTLNARVILRRSDLGLKFVGVNGQLTDSAVVLEAGGEYRIFLGGEKLSARDIKIEFNSRFLRVARSSIEEQDFGKEVSVVSFTVTVDEAAPAGVYSIFATGPDGTLTSLVGALSIRRARGE